MLAVLTFYIIIFVSITKVFLKQACLVVYMFYD